MDENRDRNRQEVIVEAAPRSGAPGWLTFLAVVALLGAGIAFGYGYTQRAKVDDLNAHQAELNSTISQMQSRIDSATAKLNDVSAAQAAAAEAAAKAQQVKAPAGTGSTKALSALRAANEKRMKELQSQLDDQGKSLKDTQDSVAQTRSDLQGNLNSTKDELNGSIARTHEEVVALQRRGERSYTEFDISKSKQFQRVGPVQLALRNADTKNKRFNVEMMVDDNKLQKKNVNLYEPIWIHTEGLPQPVQVVVNKITKNHVHGYVSAPKFRESELSAATTPRPTTPPEQKQEPPEF